MKQTDFARGTAEDRKAYIIRPYEEVPLTELLPAANSHLVVGEQLTVSFLTMKAGSEFNLHSHPHEQLMIVLEGYCEQIIDGKLYHVEKGDALYMPSNVVHGSFLEVDCKVIDVFVPRREDYIEKYKQQNPGKGIRFED